MKVDNGKERRPRGQNVGIVHRIPIPECFGDSLIESPPFRFHLGSTVIGHMNSSSDSINVGDRSLFHIASVKKQKISYC